jgi:hypothetical protein
MQQSLPASSRGTQNPDTAAIERQVELQEAGRVNARLSSGRGNKAWRARARRMIKQLYRDALAEWGMDARKVRRHIAKGYADYAGTTARMKYPYRAWSDELNCIMEQHRLREIQLSLFELSPLST